MQSELACRPRNAFMLSSTARAREHDMTITTTDANEAAVVTVTAATPNAISPTETQTVLTEQTGLTAEINLADAKLEDRHLDQAHLDLDRDQRYGLKSDSRTTSRTSRQMTRTGDAESAVRIHA